MKLVRNPDACYGCRMCELICSFHYHRAFSPRGGAITVSKYNNTGEIDWQVDLSCDFCKERTQPLCVQYCQYGALRFLED